MNYGMNYGEVALGVECALPQGAPRPPGRTRRLVNWLISVLLHRA